MGIMPDWFLIVLVKIKTISLIKGIESYSIEIELSLCYDAQSSQSKINDSLIKILKISLF